MPVSVIYHPNCDQNFRRDYHNVFQQWMNSNPRHTSQNILFDQALVLSVIDSITGSAVDTDLFNPVTVYTLPRAFMIPIRIRTLPFSYQLLP